MNERPAVGKDSVMPPVGERVEWLEQVDSTNNVLKQRAAEGAPHGLVVVAREQTGGRGRMGRSFESPKGKGLYFSVLLRPDCLPAEAVDLTSWIAVAVCRAIENHTGLRAGIKWTNDVLLEGKKVCGILTEMQTSGSSLDWVVAGIGINLDHQEGDLSPQVAAIATSLGGHMPSPPTAEELTAALIGELNEMAEGFPGEKMNWLAEYRRRCVTLGREVEVRRGSRVRFGRALALDDDFRLVVEFENGVAEALDGGEVSVKGLC